MANNGLNNTHYFIDSVGQESGHCFSGSSAQGSWRLQSRCQPGLGSHLKV